MICVNKHIDCVVYVGLLLWVIPSHSICSHPNYSKHSFLRVSKKKRFWCYCIVGNLKHVVEQGCLKTPMCPVCSGVYTTQHWTLLSLTYFYSGKSYTHCVRKYCYMQTDCHDAFPLTSLWKLVSYIYSYGLVQYINALSLFYFLDVICFMPISLTHARLYRIGTSIRVIKGIGLAHR